MYVHSALSDLKTRIQSFKKYTEERKRKKEQDSGVLLQTVSSGEEPQKTFITQEDSIGGDTTHIDVMVGSSDYDIDDGDHYVVDDDVSSLWNPPINFSNVCTYVNTVL